MGKLVAGALSAACAFTLALAVTPMFGSTLETAPSGDAARPESSASVSEAAAVVEGPDVFAGSSDAESESSVSTWEVSADGSVVIDAEHERDIVIVQFGMGAEPASLTEVFAALPCLDESAAAVTEADIEAGYIALPVADGYNVADAIAALGDVPGAISPQPNYLYRLADEKLTAEEGATAIAADSASSLLAGTALLEALEDVNDTYAMQSATSYNWHLQSINAYDAWSIVKGQNLTGNDRVTVAVLDTGYDTDHQDLTVGSQTGVGGNVVATYDATINDNLNPSTGVADVSGHGTHVAGLVSAIANNETGVAGVSYNANILPIQVFHKETYTENGQSKTGYFASTTSLKTAYSYINANRSKYNIRVANMSIGGPQKDSSPDQLAIEAVETAYNNGVLTVCAAGNSDSNNGTVPYTNIVGDNITHGMSVIALDKPVTNASTNTTTISRASYSNYNTSAEQTKKDISAPGTSVYSTTFNGSYGTKSGTSMASPIVAGVAALVFTANPVLSPAEVIGILHSTATDLTPANSGSETSEGFDQYTGYGEVNAQKAVENAGVYLAGSEAMLAGETLTLTPTISAPDGSWTWNSSAPEVATVEDGVVSATSTGTVTITATSGDKTASKTITVYGLTFYQADNLDEPIEEIGIELGETVQIAVSYGPVSSGGLWSAWGFTIANGSLATGSASGDNIVSLTGVSTGETYLTATLKENANISVRLKVKVLESSTKRNLESSNTTVSWPFISNFLWYTTSVPYYYTGFPITPEPTVRYKASSGSSSITTTLKLGTDYEMSYANNKDVGTATATITGIGSYEGTVSREFTIQCTPLVTAYNKGALSISGLDDVRYTGSPLQPEPVFTLTLAGSYTLVKDVDYTIGSYSNNTEIARYSDANPPTIAITGIGNFSGDASLNFTIQAATLSTATVSTAGWTYDGTAHTPSIAVTHNGAALAQDGNWTYEITKGGAGVAPNAVKDAGTYTVTVTGEGNYTDSATTTFTVSPRSIAGATVTTEPVSHTYDGNAKKPAVKQVKLANGTVLSSGDYLVAYSNNVNAGTATVKVTGQGNYSGTASTTFAISPAPITGVSLGRTSYVYDGTAKTPAVVVAWAGGAVPASGYSVVYSNNVEIGTARATAYAVEGGNFTGSASAAFEITEPALEPVEPDPVVPDPVEPDDPGSGSDPTVQVSSMFRLYNEWTGEHFYTASTAERDGLVDFGWVYEGVGWSAPAEGDPVYRLYNSYAGDHHYTLSAAERDELVASGWTDEGVGWYSGSNKSVPLYREYNPNMFSCNHNYTADRAEHETLVALGWHDEGVGWYGA